MNTDIDDLRHKHRCARAALTESVLEANAEALSSRVAALAEFREATHIAAYIAIRGEIDLAMLMAACDNKQQWYLPVLCGEKMLFAPWRPGQPLEKKGFGLLEPASTDWIDPLALDLVLAPLVVFDAFCNRIGQGGGYYDRTFAHRLAPQPGAASKPVMLGVAHESQREPKLQPQNWDVPLDLVVTEQRVYRRQAGQC